MRKSPSALIQKLFLAVLFVQLGACRLAKNFHEVYPGELYRSAQLTGPEFQQAVDHYGIKTIINLRGENPGRADYQAEKAVADKNGVVMVNISMSAKRLPHKEDLQKLLLAFENAPKPFLIHCQQGADRTGEAVAIYENVYKGKSVRQATKDSLSFKYLHVEKFKPAKVYFMKHVWQGFDWAFNSYDPCKADYKYYDKSHCQADSEQVEEESASELADPESDS